MGNYRISQTDLLTRPTRIHTFAKFTARQSDAHTDTKTVGVEASGCERLAHSRYAVVPRPGNRTRDLLIASPAAFRCATTPPY